jgi:hypothetical protein
VFRRTTFRKVEKLYYLRLPPNITYLSRVRMVDGEPVALSNQFFSKTARNLVENPRASVLVVDPCTSDQ